MLISRFRRGGDGDAEEEEAKRRAKDELRRAPWFKRQLARLRLRFEDEVMEKNFLAFYIKHTLFYLRLYVVVGIAFFFGATFIDWRSGTFDGQWNFFLSVVRTPLAILYFVFTFLPMWRRHVEGFSVAIVMSVFVSSLVLSVSIKTDDTSRVILTLMFFYLLVLIRYYLLFAICSAYVVIHIIIIGATGKPWSFILIATLLLCNATGGFMSFMRESNIRRAFTALQLSLAEHKRTQEQKNISENLLYSVLPKRIVASMHERENVVEAYDNLCFLASDVEGFTSYSTRVAPQVVVDMLNHMFTYFDLRARHYRLDKVKTIGDAYLLAGRPGKTGAGDVAYRMALMALDMQEYIETVFPVVSGEKDIHMRIGLHVGPAVAGLVGLKKSIWDVFGDAVSIAERMEQTGVVAQAHCSDLFRKVVQLSRSDLIFERHDKVKLSSGSVIDTWLISLPEAPPVTMNQALQGVTQLSFL
jgi:class 3 adenylate cyclase